MATIKFGEKVHH